MIEEQSYAHSEMGCHHHGGKCALSWSAIIVGALSAIGFSFLLNIFALAIGLTAFKTSASGNTIVIGGYIGLIIGIVVTMFVAGWISGKVASARVFHRCFGALHGFAVWCLALCLSVALSAPVIHYVHFYYESLSNPKVLMQERNHHRNSLQNPVVSEQNTAATTTTDQDNNTKTVTVAPDVGSTLFFTFILFFLGAIFASIGGYCGLRPHVCTSTVSARKVNTTL